jgi:tRNA threonylcarbamoyl adenosine modification protein YeaZ
MLSAAGFLLSIDLSSPIGSIALFSLPEGGGRPTLLSESTLGESGKHSEALIPTIDVILKQEGIPLDRIRRFVTSSGPGSFTGLRVAFASLKAFSLITQAPVEVIEGHEARALAYVNANPSLVSPRLRIATAVTKDSYWLTVYSWEVGSGLRKESEALSHSLDALSDTTTLLAEAGAGGNYFPLRAAHLGAALADAKSRATYASPEALSQMVPFYFGSKQYS